MYLFDSICYIQLTPEMGMDKIRKRKIAVENGDGGRSVKIHRICYFSNRLK